MKFLFSTKIFLKRIQIQEKNSEGWEGRRSPLITLHEVFLNLLHTTEKFGILTNSLTCGVTVNLLMALSIHSLKFFLGHYIGLDRYFTSCYLVICVLWKLVSKCFSTAVLRRHTFLGTKGWIIPWVFSSLFPGHCNGSFMNQRHAWLVQKIDREV